MKTDRETGKAEVYSQKEKRHQLYLKQKELLDTFLYLKEQGVSILFSTHITTDLEKCADDITYLAAGKQIASMPMDAFLAQHGGKSLEEIMVQYEKESLHEKLAE